MSAPASPTITAPRNGLDFSTNVVDQIIAGTFAVNQGIEAIVINNTRLQDGVNGSLPRDDNGFLTGSYTYPVQLNLGKNVFSIRAINSSDEASDPVVLEILLVPTAELDLAVSPVTGIDKRVKRDSVQIIWQQNTEPEVESYNVYFSTIPGGGLDGYRKINPADIVDPDFVEEQLEEVARLETVTNEKDSVQAMPITAQNDLVSVPLVPALTTLVDDVSSVQISWELTGTTNLTNCVSIRLKAPDGSIEILKQPGEVNPVSVDITDIYTLYGPGQYFLMLEEVLGCSAPNLNATLSNAKLKLIQTKDERIVTTTSKSTIVNMFTFYHDTSAYDEGTPLYYVITAVGFNSTLRHEVESVYTDEIVAVPFSLNTDIEYLPERTFAQIVKSYVDRVLAFEPGVEKPDVKPGTVWRDIAIDPPAKEAELEYRIIDFVSRSQSFLTLLEFDDQDGDGISDLVSESSPKRRLQEALGADVTDAQLQDVIDQAFDNLAANVLTFRKPAVQAQGEVIFFKYAAPNDDLRAPAGSILTSLADAEAGIESQQYELLEDVSLFKDSAVSFFVPERNRYEVIGQIRAITPGSAGNIPAGFINSVVAGSSGLFGFDGVENLEATVFGADEEANSSLAERAMLAFVSVDVGTENGYKSTALRVSNVRKANVVGAGDYYMQRDWFCLCPGAKITLADGSVKNVEDIELGDRVLTHDGSSGRVKSIMSRKVSEDIRKIQIASVRDPLLVTKEHPFLALNAENVTAPYPWAKEEAHKSHWGRRKDLVASDFSWKDAGDLKEKDVLFIPTPVFDDPEMTFNLTEDLVEFLGWYAAEGYTYPEESKGWLSGIVICLGKHELEYMDRVKQLAKNLQGLHKIDNEKQKKRGWFVEEKCAEEHFGVYVSDQRLKIYNPALAMLCKDHVGHGARRKKLSLALMSVLAKNESFTKRFIKAFACGDANLATKTSSVVFGTSSLNLREQLYWLLSVSGIFSRRGFVENSGGPKHREKRFPYYKLYVSKSSAAKWWDEFKILHRNSAPYSMDVWKIAASQAAEIKSVETLFYQGMVYNFEVEGNNSYLANGVAVHNCPTLEHIGGKVDIYLQGDVLQQIQETFAFNFIEVRNERVTPSNSVGQVVHVGNTDVTQDKPVFKVVEVTNISRGGAAYDLTGLQIVEGVYIDLDETCPINVALGMGPFDIIEISYFYRGSEPFIFTSQPVRQITHVIGEFSGELEAGKHYKLFKLEDQLLLGDSTRAQDYMVIKYEEGLPLGQFKTIVDEPHTLISDSPSNLVNFGVIIPSIVVEDVTHTVTYTVGTDYTILAGDNKTRTRIKRIAAGAIINGQEVRVSYESGELFVVSYKVNKLLGTVQKLVEGYTGVPAKRHVTADVVVKDVQRTKIDLEFTILLKRGVSKQKVDPELRTNISRFLNQRPVGESVYASDIIRILDETSGVDHVILPLTKMVKADGSVQVFERVLGSELKLLPYIFDYGVKSYISAYYTNGEIITNERHTLNGVAYSALDYPGVITPSVMVANLNIDTPTVYVKDVDYVVKSSSPLSEILNGQVVHVSYQYSSPLLQVNDEPHVLVDGRTETLQNAAVLLNSVVVKNESHTTTYVLSQDYELRTNAGFTEIFRSGAQFTYVARKLTDILDGQSVYVSYTYGIGSTVVTNEPHVLNAITAVALDFTNVNSGSIVITNVAQTITYVDVIDYVVSVDGPITSISRKSPAISDGQQVNITYNALRFGEEGRIISGEEAVLYGTYQSHLQNLGVVETTVRVESQDLSILYVRDVDYVISTDNDGVTSLARTLNSTIENGQILSVYYQASNIAHLQVLKHKSVAGGSSATNFKGFWIDEVPSELVDDPALVALKASRAYINSDGSIVISKSDGDFNHVYNFTYQVFGDTGQMDILVSDIEAVELGNLIIAYGE